MKHLLLGSLMILSLSVAARTPEEKKALLESQNSCQNFVRFDEDYLFMGYGPYKQMFEEPRLPIPGSMTLVSFDSKESKTIQTSDSVIDVVTDAGHAFLLTYSAIEEWDLGSMTKIADYPTHLRTPVEYKSHAESFARYQDEMIIAHGSMGVAFFDLKAKKITSTLDLITNQGDLESQATAVTVSGKFAYVTLDSLSLVNEPPRPFSGIVVIDLETKKVVKELAGLDPGSDGIVALNEKLIVSFYGLPLWKYDITDFGSRKLPNPEIRVFRFPYPGHPTGAAAMDDKYYYSCYYFSSTETVPWHLKPMALNRKSLLLE